MLSPKQQLKNLSLAELREFVISAGEPAFRAHQLYTGMYQHRARSFEAMTDLPLAFRQQLAGAASLQAVILEQVRVAPAGDARKYLFRLADNASIESVLMYDGDRRTLCISTQVGCPIDCKFCATGAMGWTRNLTTGEIIDQVIEAERESGERVSNIVVMGMGEPMLNYDNLMAALDIISDEGGLNLAKRRIVVSTSGLIPAIDRFREEKRKYRLAISLNATTDDVRTRLMPLNKKWSIAELLDAARRYSEASGEVVTFEYVLLDGINDTVDDARRLIQLLKGIRCKLNLIPYNATLREFRRSTDAAIDRFYKTLRPLPVPVTIRWSKGADIDAACGQLLTSVEGARGRKAAV